MSDNGDCSYGSYGNSSEEEEEQNNKRRDEDIEKHGVDGFEIDQITKQMDGFNPVANAGRHLKQNHFPINRSDAADIVEPVCLDSLVISN